MQVTKPSSIHKVVWNLLAYIIAQLTANKDLLRVINLVESEKDNDTKIVRSAVELAVQVEPTKRKSAQLSSKVASSET